VATAGAGELRGLMVDQLKKRGLEFDPAIEAAFRAGDAERAGRFLAERLARRPDHFWRTRAA